MVILVTGGSGFIGSAVVRRLVLESDAIVINVDRLTYAGDLESLGKVRPHPRHVFERADVADARAMHQIFTEYRPNAVIHLAAESHVDRSIDGPADFIQTNLVGTFTLLEAARTHWEGLMADERRSFRFLHVSTDEVFGALGDAGRFDESTRYDPSSPYSATKAGADHLVRAWNRTYGLPTLLVNCTNNYGPYQFPEKLIPATIMAASDRRPIPVYGSGENVRDWIFVEDHVSALCAVLERGRVGETYAVGAGCERRNIDVVRAICTITDRLLPEPSRPPREELIRFVSDRPGHDWRYALDASKVREELGWSPQEDFETGLRKTVAWYVAQRGWAERMLGASEGHMNPMDRASAGPRTRVASGGTV